jgi:glycosyltransferase involved in cell wall biosynthesis
VKVVDDNRKLVSCIIPVYNRSGMLRECVDSVLRQTYRPIEVILCDDGSTDDTADVARELVAKHPDEVRYFHQENAGPGAARNLGFAHCRGEFLQYLDSDDLIDPRKFELQVAALDANPMADVCYCITLRGTASSEMTYWAKTAEKIEQIFPAFLPKRGWATLTPLWRRSMCERVGPWKPLRVMEDWEHDLRAGILGARIVHVPEPLATVRDHAGDRASGMHTGLTPALVRDQFLAHESIWLLMQESGLTDSSYLPAFARKMFWLARMCGEKGLFKEAERALICAEQMVRLHGGVGQVRWFRAAVRLLGWRNTVRISEAVRRGLRRSSTTA